jgi:hypothetical protein
MRARLEGAQEAEVQGLPLTEAIQAPKKGKYTFEVRAVGASGPDPTSAKKKFKISG